MKNSLFLLSIVFLFSACRKDLLPTESPSSKFAWCGKFVQWTGTSITNAPGYWPSIFASWYMADALNYDHIDYRGLLAANKMQNFGHPGATAPECKNYWMRDATKTYAQVFEFSRNSLRDTASILKALYACIDSMAYYHNYDYLVLGVYNANSVQEENGTDLNLIVRDLNKRFEAIFKEKFYNPIYAFYGVQNQYELDNGFLPMRFTIGDGLHPNDAGAKIYGLGVAAKFEPCIINPQ